MKKRSRLVFWAALTLLSISCSSSGGDEPSETPDPDKPVETQPVAKMSTPQYVFGFAGQNRYSYCPSALEQADGGIHVYFCGNPQSGVMVDNIYHMYISPDGTKTQARSVLQPGENGSWDDHHTCDPSVVEGEFNWAGTMYRYAMLFLGNRHGMYYNEIGVAFSNDLNAGKWEKYPTQIVCKTWTHEGDQSLSGGGSSWGVGQPSVISIDNKGKLLLTYTIGDLDGTRVVWSEADLSDVDNAVITPPKAIVTSGLYAVNGKDRDYTCNMEFAIDRKAGRIIAIRPVQPMPADYPAYINAELEIDVMDYNEFRKGVGSWTPVCRIKPDETGFPRNHNATIIHDNFGGINDWEHPSFMYTVSKANPDVSPTLDSHAEWTYHIYMASVETE